MTQYCATVACDVHACQVVAIRNKILKSRENLFILCLITIKAGDGDHYLALAQQRNSLQNGQFCTVTKVRANMSMSWDPPCWRDHALSQFPRHFVQGGLLE